MRIAESGRMAGRPEHRICGVAEAAGEWELDFGMAHEAIGHSWQLIFRREIHFREATVTGTARVVAIQQTPHVAGLAKVLSAVDGGCQDGRHVAESHVKLVVEAIGPADNRGRREGFRRELGRRPAVVTAQARVLLRNQLVVGPGTGRGRRVAIGTRGPSGKMFLVGKEQFVRGSCIPSGDKNQEKSGEDSRQAGGKVLCTRHEWLLISGSARMSCYSENRRHCHETHGFSNQNR
jgi:hypothetical protein